MQLIHTGQMQLIHGFMVALALSISSFRYSDNTSLDTYQISSPAPLYLSLKSFHLTYYTALILLFINDSWELGFQVLYSRIPLELEPRWGVIGSGKGELRLQ